MMIRFWIPRPELRFISTALIVMMGTTAGISGDSEIDTSNVLHLMGRHSVAHACPIGPNLALTAAHVVDPRWMDSNFPLIPFRFSNDAGVEGIVKPTGVFTEADIGLVAVGPNSVGFYRLADNAPEPEDKIYWIEYNTKKVKNAFKTKLRDSKVIVAVGGHIYVDDSPVPGASGGCAFNESGEVVGIISSGWMVGFTYAPNVGGIVATYGMWKPELPEEEEDD